MATTIITTAPVGPQVLLEVPTHNILNELKKKPERHDVSTVINYYRDPGDGSPPMPVRISE
jgi:hypothetical protein